MQGGPTTEDRTGARCMRPIFAEKFRALTPALAHRLLEALVVTESGWSMTITRNLSELSVCWHGLRRMDIDPATTD